MPRGRPVGAKGKRAVEKASIEKAIAEGGLMPSEVLLHAMRYCYSLAMANAPDSDNPNDQVFDHYLTMAGDFAGKAAPYFHVKKVSVSVSPIDLSKLSDEQLSQLEQITRSASVIGSNSGREETTRH